MPIQIAKKRLVSQTQEPAVEGVTVGGQSSGYGDVDVGAGADPSSVILSKAEILKRLAQCQQWALALSPYAVGVIADASRSENPRLRLSAAIKLCEIAGVVQSGGIEQVLETTAAADQRRNDERLRFLGSCMDMMMKKSDIYEMPLSPKFAQDFQELNDKVQELARQSPLDEEQALPPHRVQASSSPPNKRGRRV